MVVRLVVHLIRWLAVQIVFPIIIIIFLISSFTVFLYRFHCNYWIDTANVVIDRLEEQSKAISLTQLAVFVETLPKMKTDLSRMKEITNGLRVNASQLSDGMYSVYSIIFNSLWIETDFLRIINATYSFILFAFLFIRFARCQTWAATFPYQMQIEIL